MARTYYLDEKDVLELLRREVERAGSQVAWAQQHGYERTSLNIVLSGRRKINPKLIELLKLKTAYVEIAEAGPRVLDSDDVLTLLREEVEKVGGQSEWGRRYGYERTYLNRVLSKKKPLPSDIIKALKLKRIYVFKGQKPEG